MKIISTNDLWDFICLNQRNKRNKKRNEIIIGILLISIFSTLFIIDAGTIFGVIAVAIPTYLIFKKLFLMLFKDFDSYQITKDDYEKYYSSYNSQVGNSVYIPCKVLGWYNIFGRSTTSSHYDSGFIWIFGYINIFEDTITIFGTVKKDRNFVSSRIVTFKMKNSNASFGHNNTNKMFTKCIFEYVNDSGAPGRIHIKFYSNTVADIGTYIK